MNILAAQTACVRLAAGHRLWILDNFLTVAIVAAVLVAAAFITYMVVRQHKH
ncbi:MAG: hypothetical protein IJY66_01760 [Clostridia bacterium]|nr:hypothetical protein [Clostridia bacterium]